MFARLGVLLEWVRINAAFMLAAFLLTGGLIALFPQAMLDIFGRYARFLEALGATPASALPSPAEMFALVLQRNALSVLIYFVIGLVLQAPLAVLFGGAFYGLVAFLAPSTIGRAFGPADWLLVAAESAAIILSASLASGFASELFQVSPTVSGWWRYFKQSWRSLLMNPVRPLRAVLASWSALLGLGLLVVAGLLLFVAWFEAYGY